MRRLYYEEMSFDPYAVRMRPLGSSYNSVDKLAIHARNGLKAAIWVVVMHVYGSKI